MYEAIEVQVSMIFEKKHDPNFTKINRNAWFSVHCLN